MEIVKPYHRNFRDMKPGNNSGHHYIRDPKYAKNAEHYVRAFTLIQNDLQSIFEYLEPSVLSKKAYSYRIHALLMRTCIEVEANFKAILAENTFTPPRNRSISMKDYRKIDFTHHLSSYEVMLPIWNGRQKKFKPFEPWKSVRGQATTDGVSLSWYKAYNASKHDRHDKFKKANFENLVMAVAGLLVLISSQFRDQDFSAGSVGLSISGYDVHPMEAAIGSLFRVKYPDDWADIELYDFNWSVLSNETDRFEKINFDEIPC